MAAFASHFKVHCIRFVRRECEQWMQSQSFILNVQRRQQQQQRRQQNAQMHYVHRLFKCFTRHTRMEGIEIVHFSVFFFVFTPFPVRKQQPAAAATSKWCPASNVRGHEVSTEWIDVIEMTRISREHDKRHMINCKLCRDKANRKWR